MKVELLSFGRPVRLFYANDSHDRKIHQVLWGMAENAYTD